MTDTDARTRLADRARAWHVTLGRVVETPTSLVGFGDRRGEDVVLKVVSSRNEEWDAGSVAAAFDGRGTVRVHGHVPGAALLEAATPGTPLVEVVEDGRDDEATRILAGVVEAMLEASPSTAGHATAEDWAVAFDDYLAGDDRQIPRDVIEEARERYADLCRSQTDVRLLHGDLQHYNVLYDDERGWLAIDPKGVVAEVAFELAAALRNPYGMPELYTSSAIERRVDLMVDALTVDRDRVVGWTFAQAVLSAVWMIEDDGELDLGGPALRVVEAARPLLS